MPAAPPDHYAALGLTRDCSDAEIRAAYWNLSKRHHPDVNPGAADAVARSQAINAAHEMLSDSARRREYDRELERETRSASLRSRGKVDRNLSQEVRLRIEDLIRGATLEVRVNDPANPGGAEIYRLVVPPETAAGAGFRVPRAAPFEGGFVLIRLRVLSNFRFKVRGSDLRSDLRIDARRAAQGGTETMVSATGGPLRVTIPRGVARGEIIRLPGEGLPKRRGGRGDLLVRVVYRPEVHVTRVAR